MMHTDIQNILPDPSRDAYKKLKTQHPYNILSKYAKALGEKYPGKLEGIISESRDGISRGLIGYAFYIVAAIGRGYSYRLLEATPTTATMYPLRITLFEKHTHELPGVSDYLDFDNVLYEIFRAEFTQTLLVNLVIQVDGYNESRRE